MVRSPHAHARIRGIDVAAALKAPGVLAVLTGAGRPADGLRTDPAPPGADEPPRGAAAQPRRLGVLHRPAPAAAGRPGAVRGRGRRHGDRRDRRRRRATPPSAVEVDYEPLPAVTATRGAAADGAPGSGGGASNVCVDSEVGDARGRRRRLRARRPRGAARDAGEPGHRRADGAARGARRVRRDDRALHALRRLGRRAAQRGPISRACSASPRAPCAWSPATSAATTARATASIPSSRWWRGRPGAWAGR